MKKFQEHYKKTPDWKQRYKNRCKLRLQDNRTKLVDKFRGITLVQEVMKSEAADMGMTPEQLNELIEVDLKFFQEIEQELLQEQAALAMGEDEPIDDSVQGPPCPACKKNFTDDGPVLCCSSCRVKITVSTNPAMNLSEMYNSWFGKHAETCGWPADVFGNSSSSLKKTHHFQSLTIRS